jgi:hypothetical protein
MVLGALKKWWAGSSFQTEAEKYVTKNLDPVVRTAAEIEGILDKLNFEQEFSELDSVGRDMRLAVHSLRELPYALRNSVAHVGELRANPDMYLRDSSTRNEVDRDLGRVIKALDGLDVLEIHLSALVASSRALQGGVGKLNKQVRKLKSFRAHANEAFEDYVLTSRAGGINLNYAANGEVESRRESKIYTSKASSRASKLKKSGRDRRARAGRSRIRGM